MNDGKTAGRRISAAMAAVLAAGAATDALAAEKLGRWTVEIEVEGAQQWKAGSDYGNAKISQRYRIVTHVKAQGDPTSVDTLDPHYAQKQMATAMAVQKRVAEAQGRSGTAAPAVPRTPAEQQAFAAKMQQEQQACGTDTRCLMDLATKYTPVMNAIAMQSMAGAAGASAADAEVDLEAEEEERFLDYFGYEGCPTEISIRIDDSAEGAYADVGGMVPWKESSKADYAGSDIDRKMQCLNLQTVYDIGSREIRTHGIGVPAAVGRHTYWDRLHGDGMLGDAGKDTQISGNGEALAWVAQQLRHAPASGSRNITLVPTQARGGTVTGGATTTGKIDVTLRWKFEPETAAH